MGVMLIFQYNIRINIQKDSIKLFEISDIYTKIGEQVSADADLLNINKEGEK